MDGGGSRAVQRMDADSVSQLLLVHLSLEFHSCRQGISLGNYYTQPSSYYNGSSYTTTTQLPLLTGNPSLTICSDLAIEVKASLHG